MRLRGKEAAREADRCAEAAEQHRLQGNDLIQQTRAANAAQESAWMAYEATRISLAGLLGGFLTIIAASFAAYYARKAYLETKRTANAAFAANEHNRTALALQLRPWMNLKQVVAYLAKGSNINGVKQEYAFCFYQVFTNTGQSPAIKAVAFAGFRIVERDAVPPAFPSEEKLGEMSIGVGSEVTTVEFGLTKEQTDRWLARESDVILFARFDYSDSMQDAPRRFTESTLRLTYNGWLGDESDQRVRTQVLACGPQNRLA
jgi:hypothetical protein